MRRVYAVVGFALVVMGSCIFADELDEAGKKIRNLEAKRAVANYRETVKTAKAQFDKQEEAARKRLLEELDRAQAKAAKENQLDEAVTIRDLRKSLQQKSGSTAAGEIQIISAFYGQNVSWLDVTDKVRESAQGNSKWRMAVNSDDLGDPVPGWKGTRTLLVRYSIGGKIQNKAVYEGTEIALP